MLPSVKKKNYLHDPFGHVVDSLETKKESNLMHTLPLVLYLESLGLLFEILLLRCHMSLDVNEDRFS